MVYVNYNNNLYVYKIYTDNSPNRNNYETRNELYVCI